MSMAPENGIFTKAWAYYTLADKTVLPLESPGPQALERYRGLVPFLAHPHRHSAYSDGDGSSDKETCLHCDANVLISPVSWGLTTAGLSCVQNFLTCLEFKHVHAGAHLAACHRFKNRCLDHLFSYLA